MGRPASSKSSERNIIPLIFTIGIISWGFFAIARMTDSSSEIIPRRGSKAERTETGTLTALKLWLLDKITKNDKTEKEIKMKTLAPIQTAIAARPDDLPVVDDPLAGIPLSAQLPETEAHQAAGKDELPTLESLPERPVSPSSAKVYLYALDKNGSPRLKSVRREISGGDVRLLALQASIKGPTAAEEMRDFIDSFPAKPKIISLQQKDDTLIINFSDNFGVGVSHSTLKFQIQQLLHTAKQFEGINAISIRINGKASRHLGGDGIAVPDRIDLASLNKF